MLSEVLLSLSLLGTAGQPAKMHECMRGAWRAANPSAEQNRAAHQIMVEVHNGVKDQIPAVREAMKGLHDAYVKHPISKQEVSAAEDNLKKIGGPVHNMIRDGQIDIVNLLDANQRNAFNESMKECFKK